MMKDDKARMAKNILNLDWHLDLHRPGKASGGVDSSPMAARLLYCGMFGNVKSPGKVISSMRNEHNIRIIWTMALFYSKT